MNFCTAEIINILSIPLFYLYISHIYKELYMNTFDYLGSDLIINFQF
jgi:hypothetical protein